MMDILKIATFLVVLMAATEGLRRLPNGARAAIWIAGSLLLLPTWVRNGSEQHWTWFSWAKLGSIMFACMWFELCATLLRRRPRLVAISILVILSVNMLEAIAFDLRDGRMVNALAGLILVACAFVVPAARIETRGSGREVVWKAGWLWIVSYTMWNLCFLYGSFPRAVGVNVASLGAAIALAAVTGSQSWLQVRAYTFGLFCFVYFTLHDTMLSWLGTSSWSDHNILAALLPVSLAGALAAGIGCAVPWLTRHIGAQSRSRKLLSRANRF